MSGRADDGQLFDLGSHYARSSQFQGQMWDRAVALLERVGIDLNVPQTLLDLGCGPGIRTKKCLELFPRLQRVLAVDSNESMIRAARSQNADPRITYLQKDIRRLDVLDAERFDVVTAHWVLHWVEEMDTLLRSLQSHVHSNSLFLIGTCERIPPIVARLDEVLRELLNTRDRLPLCYRDANGWRQLLSNCGWSIVGSDAHRVEREMSADGPYLLDWYAASCGKAFYGASFDILDAKTRMALNQKLSAEVGHVDREGTWSLAEDVLFLLALRRGGEYR